MGSLVKGNSFFRTYLVKGGTHRIHLGKPSPPKLKIFCEITNGDPPCPPFMKSPFIFFRPFFERKKEMILKVV